VVSEMVVVGEMVMVSEVDVQETMRMILIILAMVRFHEEIISR